ncbi:MAG TPA: hypothetical protein VID03_04915, partial [Acidimicrobiia bacterium]
MKDAELRLAAYAEFSSVLAVDCLVSVSAGLYNEHMFTTTDTRQPDPSVWAPDPEWDEAEAKLARLQQLEKVISRCRAEQAGLAADLDRFQVDLADGYPRMGDWLAATLDLGSQTADRLWQLARTDEDIRQHLADGRWGLDRSAALAKLRQAGATPQQFQEAADNYTLGRIHALTDRLRHLHPEQEQALASDRYLVVQPDLAAQMMKLWGILPAADGETVLTALDRKESTFPNLPDQNRGQRRADALVAICTDSLNGDGGGGSGGGGLVADIFIDAAQAAETGAETGAVTRRGLKAGPGLLEEILCGGKIRAIATDGLRPVAVTDATTPIPPSVRAFVWWRDMGQCAIDG